MAVVLDGKKLAERILQDLRKEIKKGGRRLNLAVVFVGADPQSKIFLRQKQKACQKVGVGFKLHRFPQHISQDKLAREIKKLGRDKLCHGILIQLPLPQHLDTDKILDLIPAQKDVDRRPLSPVLAGILALLKEYKINFQGKKVAVVGRGRLVGKPVINWLKKQNIALAQDTRKADILISGVGQPNLINGEMVKEGAVVVDVAGDIEPESVSQKAGYLTPVPGGIGPMTCAMVIKNLIALNQ